MVVEGHIIGMGNHRGGKREWGGKEEGGRGQFTSNLGPEWTGIAPHAKEGFQVSKKDSRSSGARRQVQGIQGIRQQRGQGVLLPAEGGHDGGQEGGSPTPA